MEVEQLKDDVRQGRIGIDQLIDAIAAQSRQLQAANQRIAELEKKLAGLEKKLGGAVTTKFDQPFSLRAEEQRQAARGKKSRKRQRPLRRGRVTTAEKIQQAERTEQVFPANVPEKDCGLSHTRPVWRLESGRAVLVAYEMYRGPRNQFGKIPGVLGRGEFGVEILIAIAYQVYLVGLSFDKVCLLMNFFQHLRLRKSQVDALLKQLARHWVGEFERLCTLLAHSAVVHADETSWSLNSVWAFLSERARVLWFGVHKDAATLEQILDPATFAGIVVSDDAAVYADFTNSQKCWAHLLRKAIKLTLLEPANDEYRRLTDRRLEISRTAGRVQRDRQLSRCGSRAKSGRPRRRDSGAVPADVGRPVAAARRTGQRLSSVGQRNHAVDAGSGVVHVRDRPAGGDASRPSHLWLARIMNPSASLRSAAEARKTGRTNKTIRGARRQTIIVSVMESLRCYLPTFTLATVIHEIERWLVMGQSCFATWLARIELNRPAASLLDRVLPLPSG